MGKTQKRNIFGKSDKELKCSKIDDMMMRYYVTVSKSCLFYFWFCSEPARGRRDSTAHVILHSLPLLLGLKVARCVSHF